MSAKLIVGIDDATRCPCIGSLFVSGVAANRTAIKKWKELGVKDSKLISRKKRDILAEHIKETADGYFVVAISPQEIDDKMMNLNDREMLSVLKIIQNLQDELTFGKVYVDNWETSESGFWRRMHKFASPDLFAGGLYKLEETEIIPRHKADEKYTVVGAASILSKSGSDAEYDRYRLVYGDFGSGNPGDIRTRKFLWRHRHKPPEIVRTSWKTFQQIRCSAKLA